MQGCALRFRYFKTSPEGSRLAAMTSVGLPYVQQSPWLNVANRQMELMGRYMAEIGLTPASRSRISAFASSVPPADMVTKVEFVTVYQDREGKRVEVPMNVGKPVDANPSRENRFAADEADEKGDANTLKICLTGPQAG